jgi:peptidoglycan/xylan/chitin deacetylase (PgdA/CDA1 family)
MKRTLLLSMLRVARRIGLFELARALTSRQLRILCYHGAALQGENVYKPTLFMTSETFSRRMEYLARARYPVLSLDEALVKLRAGRLRNCATVLTFDDGWYGTCKLMMPVLERHGFPATLYVSTYYVANQFPVFNIAAEYVFESTAAETIDLAEVSPRLKGSYDLRSRQEKTTAYWKVVDFAFSLDGAVGRQAVLRSLCDVLGVSWRVLERERLCAFVSLEELREMRERGFDLQLHTHRHRFRDFESAEKEIRDNRQILARVADGVPRHFCYPGGEYTREQASWLQALGIASATTSKSGLNRRSTPPYELRRFVDSERVSMLEFEAELSGFFELMRQVGIAV